MTPPSEDGFGLTVQRLPTDSLKVLVLADQVAMKNESLRFETSDVDSLFEALRLPRPTNTSARLADLRSKQLVMRNRDGTWSVTPEGQVAAIGAVGEIDPAFLAAELAGVPGAELGHTRHVVIRPTQAPAKWTQAISRLLSEFPFERNVFLMTRFPVHSSPDPVSKAVPAVKAALANHGLTLHMASDRQLDDDVLGNVAAHMWACQYGVGLLEDVVGRGLNQNVLIELGAMVMTGRRCAFLRDKTSPDLPSDFVGHIYKNVDLDDPRTLSTAVHQWASVDLGLGKCRSCE